MVCPPLRAIEIRKCGKITRSPKMGLGATQVFVKIVNLLFFR
jgi:hypothetical protein